MASIQKVATGWRVQISVKGQRDDRTFDTKSAAQEWAVRREAELRSIQGGQGSKTHTVGDVLDEYQKAVSPTKRGTRWEILRLELIGRKKVEGKPFREIRLADLKPQHIAAWRDVRAREVAGSSVSREMSLLSHALEVARKEWGWLITDPMKDVRRPPDNPPRQRLVGNDEIERITLALGYQEGKPVALPSQRVAVAFLLAIETAMRSGEILGLTSQTVDYDRRVAHLPLTKNGGARDVPLSTRAVELLRRLPAVEVGEPLFRLSSASRDALFRKAKEKAGIAGLTFHDTRHEAITRLAKKLQPLDLARMTGHTNLQELMTYYNESAENIAQRLG
ncbi:site-specific integrase [Ralstonia solanacearum]|nr:integrase [Ralstonia solanacearum FJAT-1458]QKL71474.1 site-specific integrase [Ralstonia solanacearum]QKL76683.1 site-specific integrase [Ralstonia solanacearum]QKL81887.1 site-specific integrase [Ralstonia solanacearum]QKL87098.1 site-specific integrase [Ralstonia solanacearum]